MLITTAIITQSNYIPWKGYFDSMQLVDDFVLYDTAQYTRRDWRNRNQIKTQHGVKWLSIPVQVRGKFEQRICDTQVLNTSWCDEHWATISQSYSKAPYFKDFKLVVGELYHKAKSLKFLTDINRLFLTELSGLLNISTRFSMSSDYVLSEGKTERLVAICEQLGARRYLSGPSARSYLDESLFEKSGIEVDFLDFSSYPEYSQVHGEFVHGVSVLDLLFNVGPDAKDYLKWSSTRQ